MPLFPKPAKRTRLSWLCVTLRLLAYPTAVVLGLLFLHSAVLAVIGWLFPGLQSTLFDLAVYGAYPTESFKSFRLPGPTPNVVQWDESCNEGLILVSPHGAAVGNSSGPMILDARGRLVWTTDRYAKNGTAMNLRMQTWKGEKYLTFWVGTKFGFAGRGAYYMLDSSYNFVRTVHAVGREGDLHEFDITESGTAVLTMYAEKQVDLRQMGMWRPQDGWIFESMFQEIDLDTGDLLFEWRASERFGVEASTHQHPLAGYSEWLPFDFFHINSVQKDALGNYLVSSRHLGAILYINGSTGDTEWILGGGKLNDFHDLSEGRATEFSWQHDARWVSSKEDQNRVRTLSLLDNASAGPFQFRRVASESQGIIVRLDLAKMTAELIQSYKARKPISAASQGSVQVLPPQNSSSVSRATTVEPDSHVFVNWGSAFANSEFALNGTLLCETHIAASWSFWWERVKSYRAFKVFDWVARPEDPPAAVVIGDKVFVSWNGATEVRSWMLQGRRQEEGEQGRYTVKVGEEDLEWETLSTLPKSGFETSFALPPQAHQLFHSLRVAALDKNKSVLRHSDAIALPSATNMSSTLTIVAVVLLVLALVTCLFCFNRSWFGRRWSRRIRPFFVRQVCDRRGGMEGELDGKWTRMREG